MSSSSFSLCVCLSYMSVVLQDVENGRSRVAATERHAQAESRLAEARGNLEVSKAEVSLTLAKEKREVKIAVEARREG